MNRGSLTRSRPRSISVMTALYVVAYVAVLGLLSSLQVWAKGSGVDCNKYQRLQSYDSANVCRDACKVFYCNDSQTLTSVEGISQTSTNPAFDLCECTISNVSVIGQTPTRSACIDVKSPYTKIADSCSAEKKARANQKDVAWKNSNAKPNYSDLESGGEKSMQATSGQGQVPGFLECEKLSGDKRTACLKKYKEEHTQANAAGDAASAPGAGSASEETGSASSAITSGNGEGAVSKAQGDAPNAPGADGKASIAQGELANAPGADGAAEKAMGDMSDGGAAPTLDSDPTLGKGSEEISKLFRQKCGEGKDSTTEECQRLAAKLGEQNTFDDQRNALQAAHCKANPSLKGCKTVDNSDATKTINISGKCGTTAMMAMSRQAIEAMRQDPTYSATIKSQDGKITKSQLMTYISEHNEIKSEAESKYQCDADEDTLHAFEVISQMTDITMQMGTGVASGIAVANTQNAALKNEDVFREGAQQMKNTLIATGTQQSIIGGGQITMGAIAATVKSKHSDGLEEMDALEQQKGSRTVKAGDKDERGMSAIGASVALREESEVDAKEAEGAGRQQMDSMRGVHNEIKQKANATMTQLIVQGVMNAAQGAAKLTQGLLLQVPDANNNNNNPPPLVAASPEGYVDNGQGGVNFNPTPTGNEIVAEGMEDSPNGIGDGGEIPPPILGAGPGGGLKDSPVPGNGGFVSGAGSTNGGAGGGAGGLAGGSPSADGGAGDGASESMAQGAVKFDPTSGNAPVGFAGAGGSKRMGETGMDLNGLLAQFLPKKEEGARGPAGSILDYGDGKRKNIGPGDQDDGSILGPNSNLFVRVSNTMMVKFKTGNLR